MKVIAELLKYFDSLRTDSGFESVPKFVFDSCKIYELGCQLALSTVPDQEPPDLRKFQIAKIIMDEQRQTIFASNDKNNYEVDLSGIDTDGDLRNTIDLFIST